MDLTQMYLASPDYIKLIWITVPFLTAYGVVRLVTSRSPKRESQHPPKMKDADLILLPMKLEQDDVKAVPD